MSVNNKVYALIAKGNIEIVVYMRMRRCAPDQHTRICATGIPRRPVAVYMHRGRNSVAVRVCTALEEIISEYVSILHMCDNGVARWPVLSLVLYVLGFPRSDPNCSAKLLLPVARTLVCL